MEIRWYFQKLSSLLSEMQAGSDSSAYHTAHPVSPAYADGGGTWR